MSVTVERQTLDFPDFCKTLGIGETKGRELVQRGVVPCIRVGRRRLIAKRIVDEILSGQRSLGASTDDNCEA